MVCAAHSDLPRPPAPSDLLHATFDSLRETPFVISVLRDITDRKRHREQLIRSVIEEEDRERARIASELHDGLGKVLSAANMRLEAARALEALIEQYRSADCTVALEVPLEDYTTYNHESR